MTSTTDRAAWLAERRSGVGASDVAGIGGVSPYASPFSVWADKVGLLPLDDVGVVTPSMLLGRELEPLIGRWFTRETGLVIAGEQTLVRHRANPWWFATVDGFVLDDEGGSIDDALGVFEAKYAADPPWDDLPTHYAWQVQWQLCVSGLPRAWLACLHLPFGRPRFEVYEIARDDGLIADIARRVERFWYEHVATGAPPPVDAHDATTSALAVAYATTERSEVEIDDAADLVEEVRRLRRARDLLGDHLAAAENELKARLGTATDGLVEGRVAVYWRPSTRTTVDSKRLHAEQPATWERYSTTTEVRPLKLATERRTA